MIMTHEHLIRMAKEAGGGLALTMSSNPRISNAMFSGKSLEHFADLVIADFLQRNGQYVTNDASREAAINAAHLAGQRAMRDQAETACRTVKVHVDGYHQYTAHKVRGECSLAVQRLMEVKP